MLLTVKEAAKLLKMTEEEIHEHISARTIPAHKVDDQYRFNRPELLEWASERGQRLSVSSFPAAVDDARPMPRLSEALARGGVHDAVGGTDRDSVLRAVVERMPVSEEDRDLLVDVLIAREALGSTGLGDGIAIPHVRMPVVLHVSEASVTLSYVQQPVDFGAVDGKPVHTIFSMVTPTIRQHLHLLSRLAAALHDKAFRAAVARRANADEIIAEASRVEGAFAVPPPRSRPSL
jgi:PTS system nitrogen regulatory IIA component